MRIFRIMCIFSAMMLTFPVLHAQDFLQKAKNYLDAGDCENAQKAYDAYKVEHPNGNAEVERRIAECEGKFQRLILDSYVDLALPSGTLWKKENEIGYFTDTEISEFYNNLPTTEQFGELLEHCSWIKTNDGYQVVGTNGNVVFLQARGLKNIYSSEKEQEANGQLYYLTRDFYYFGDHAGYDKIHKWVFVISEGALNYICSSPGESYSVRFVYKK